MPIESNVGTATQADGISIDSWAEAFAALEPKSEEVDKRDTDDGGRDHPDEDATSADGQQEIPDMDESGNDERDEGDLGGLDTSPGEVHLEGGNAFGDAVGITDEQIQQYEQELKENVRDRAIREIAEEFVKRGIRNDNGVLGASLDDPDICKRDSDGVPRFYNPETGREFTGDNPRRQAQEWVDDYNKELARVFNNACEQYERHLMEESAPRLAVMKFAPKYEKLDDIRRGMFDNVIEDYEIRDESGKIVGYQCDLDKALALVDRQIAMIQGYARQHQQQNQQPPQVQAGPALDMKTTNVNSSNEAAPPKSLAEAMERIQDAQLAKMRK